MVERVVGASGFTDDDHIIRVCTIRFMVFNASIMESLSPVLGRLNDTCFTRCAHEGCDGFGEVLVTLVELVARIDEFLLAKDGELIGS